MRAILFIGFILGALLLTPLGRDVAEIAMSELRPAAPVKTAQEIAACKEAWSATHPHGYYDHVPCS